MKKSNRKVYNQMLKYAKLMTAYQTDITRYDKATLETFDGNFLWLWNEMGTHFIRLHWDVEDLKWNLSGIKENLKSQIETIDRLNKGRIHKWFCGNTRTGEFAETQNPIAALKDALEWAEFELRHVK